MKNKLTKKSLLITFFVCCVFCVKAESQKLFQTTVNKNDRTYWVESMIKIVEPVFLNLSQNTLRKNMPVETNEGYNTGKRKDVSHLEALGRSFCGIAPWIALPVDNSTEGKLRSKFLSLITKSITNAVDPSSPDYMPFDGPGSQPLVDAAFFAHGLLRSKGQVWARLNQTTRERIIKEFKASRKIKPNQNNWLLFSAMVEVTLLELTGECEMNTINYAIEKHKQWYKGDGWYGDGENFHFDYYNSFVIHPMLLDIMAILRDKGLDKDDFYKIELKRIIRFAQQQEMMISPEGTYPVVGRSSGYRFGAFQALSQVSLMKLLPSDIEPSQVRSALTKVINRQLTNETFDRDGWLTLGVCGHQPALAESYVSTGSAYLCTSVFLPLGLPADDPFWSNPAKEWTSVKIWSGKSVKADHSIK